MAALGTPTDSTSIFVSHVIAPPFFCDGGCNRRALTHRYNYIPHVETRINRYAKLEKIEEVTQIVLCGDSFFKDANVYDDIDVDEVFVPSSSDRPDGRPVVNVNDYHFAASLLAAQFLRAAAWPKCESCPSIRPVAILHRRKRV